MAAKICKVSNASPDETETTYLFFCPACAAVHPFQVPRWTWNGSFDKPTFTPSLLVHPHARVPKDQPRCHSFVTDGKISFCADSDHGLACQTVDLPDWGPDMW